MQHDMFACGQAGLPDEVMCCGKRWRRETTFKHDFFACTGLYVNPFTGHKIVLKLNRIQSFFGIGMGWLGRFLRNREMKILRQLEDIGQFPRIMSTFGNHGLMYHYIEGKSLDEKPVIPDNFFYRLGRLVEKMHDRHVCYMDMNKRGNILVGDDDRPYLIDFQISLLLPGRWRGFLRGIFQKEDIYHLLKQKRRYRPDLLSQDEWIGSRRKSVLIRVHRIIGIPFRQIRRFILGVLYRKKLLVPDARAIRSPENDHIRFIKDVNRR